MTAADKKARAKVTPGGYVQIDGYMLDCPAWKALIPDARVLYLVLKRRVRNWKVKATSGGERRKTNNGKIALSHREAMAETGRSDHHTRKAFADLIDKGFIKITKNSSFSVKLAMAREYALTEFSTFDALDKIPSKDFVRWKPAQPAHRLSAAEVERKLSQKKNSSVRTGDTVGEDGCHRDHAPVTENGAKNPFTVRTGDTVKRPHGEDGCHTSITSREGPAREGSPESENRQEIENGPKRRNSNRRYLAGKMRGVIARKRPGKGARE